MRNPMDDLLVPQVTALVSEIAEAAARSGGENALAIEAHFNEILAKHFAEKQTLASVTFEAVGAARRRGGLVYW